MDVIKNNILLNILNNILQISGHSPIQQITEFSIKRTDLIKPENKVFIEGQYDEIFKYFKKDKSHYRRSLIKHYIVVLLKHMCKELGFEWKCQEVEFGLVVGNDKYRKRTINYSILPL